MKQRRCFVWATDFRANAIGATWYRLRSGYGSCCHCLIADPHDGQAIKENSRPLLLLPWLLLG